MRPERRIFRVGVGYTVSDGGVKIDTIVDAHIFFVRCEAN